MSEWVVKRPSEKLREVWVEGGDDITLAIHMDYDKLDEKIAYGQRLADHLNKTGFQ